MPPPKPALLGRVCKPSGSTSPEVPSVGGALCAISHLAVPHIPAPHPPQPLRVMPTAGAVGLPW